MRPDPSPPHLVAFEAQRPRLLRLAYRMLGSWAEAQDVVQDAWLRWDRINRAADKAVDSPAAYLARITTRLCLDRMKSSRTRREVYVGAWLPEPLLDTLSTPSAEQAAESIDDLSLPLMVALERLSPLERAAFLLHDVFDVPLAQVAATLKRTHAAARQLAARARVHIREARPRHPVTRPPVTRQDAERIAQAFHAAARDGDTHALSALLAADAVLTADGGGKVQAAYNPIVGLPRLLRFYAGLRRKQGPERSRLLRVVWIDGLPGLITLEPGPVLQTTALEIEDGRIVALYVTRNPDKLGAVRRTLEAQGCL